MEKIFTFLLILLVKTGYTQVPLNQIPNSSFELGNLGANMHLIPGNGRLYNIGNKSERINDWRPSTSQESINNTPEWRSFASDNVWNSTFVVCVPLNINNANFQNPFIDDKYIRISKDLDINPLGEFIYAELKNTLDFDKLYKIRVIGQGELSNIPSLNYSSVIEIHLTTPSDNWNIGSNINNNMMSMMYCTYSNYECRPRSFEFIFKTTKHNLKQIVLQANSNKKGFFIDRVELYEYCTDLLTRQGRVYKFDKELEEAGTIISGSVINDAPAMGDVVMLDGSITTFKASKEVKLTEGFYVNRGADFTAKIAPCGHDCPTTNIDLPSQYVLCNNDCINLLTGTVSRGLTVNWTSQNAQNLEYLSSANVINPIFCPPSGTSGVYEYDVVIQNGCGEITTKRVSIKYFASSTPNPTIMITNSNLADMPSYPEISVATTEYTEYVTYDILDCNGNLIYTETFTFFNQQMPPAPAQFKFTQFVDPCGCYKIRIRNKNYCSDIITEQIMDWNRSQNLSNLFFPNVTLCKDGKRYICFDGKGIKQFELEIFNRWGNRMLQLNQNYTTDPFCIEVPADWSNGVYYFVIKFTGCNGEINRANGTITVIGCSDKLLSPDNVDTDSLEGINLSADSLFMVVSPNPAYDVVNINFFIPNQGQVKIKMLDKNLNDLFIVHDKHYTSKGAYQISTQVQQIPAGINYCLLEFNSHGTKKIHKRFTLIK